MKKELHSAGLAADGNDTPAAIEHRQDTPMTDCQIVAAIQHRTLRLSSRALRAAMAAAWRDIPVFEQRLYLQYAELAVLEDDLEGKEPS